MRNWVWGLLCGVAVAACADELDLNGNWAFRFEENRPLEEVADANFAATDVMCVPGCFDTMPKWLWKRGTGLYRRTFTLERAVENAWLVVEGVGLRGEFRIDGKTLGVHPRPYAQLELATGPLAAGTHTLFAALDNRFDWERLKLARTFYDFYFYGGIYRGMKLVFDNRRLRVRTRNYAVGEIELEAVNFAAGDFTATAVFDATNRVAAAFRGGRARVRVPGFRLWSPEAPNLHTVALAMNAAAPQVLSFSTRFGIREIKAEKGKMWLNGRPLFLKGVNRHEQCEMYGAATDAPHQLRDLQLLKSLNGNFIRGAHYQQSQRFLDLCDEVGVLVWEESLGWGNGQNYTKHENANEFTDPEFCRLQIEQTRDMVRASFNHPSVIIFGFLNEPQSGKKECKALVDQLVATIKEEDSGRLTTFACNIVDTDISNAATDLISINAYPGTIPSLPGTPEELREQVRTRFDSAVARFRKLYPEKPIMVSECGVGAHYGRHDPAASVGSEEFQVEYLTDIFEVLWANPDVSGYAIWQFTDTNTHRRNSGRKWSGRALGMSIAGIVDFQRRPKLACETVRKFFGQK